jgi:hypothetical protein
MQACIDACNACSVTCLSMATGHCLEMGGEHAAPEHIRIMLDCAEICGVAVNFMARQSEHHPHICRECAEICRACAKSCAKLEGMEECVEACRHSADECDRMAE